MDDLELSYRIHLAQGTREGSRYLKSLRLEENFLTILEETTEEETRILYRDSGLPIKPLQPNSFWDEMFTETKLKENPSKENEISK